MVISKACTNDMGRNNNLGVSAPTEVRSETSEGDYNMDNELAIKKPPFRMGVVGLAAKKAAAAAKAAEEKPVDQRTVPLLPPAEMPDRIGIVMDDSGSMGSTKMRDAHSGIEEFMRCCKPTTTAVAVYPMNRGAINLNTKLPETAIMVANIHATGSTPLLETLDKMIEAEPLTRAIVFSDGSPNNEYTFNEVVAKCVAKEIPVDTVYIADTNYENTMAENFMRRLAEATGGIFMKFEAGKSTFKNSFKYLSPGMRAMLMDDNFKARVERGEA